MEKVIATKSVLSNETVYSAPSLFYKHIADKVAKMDEALKLGEQQISEKDASELTLENAGKKLNNISTVSTELTFGNNSNNTECTTCFDSHNNYRTSFLIKSRYTAYCFWPRIVEYAFGCVLLFSSNFCINCYHSSHLTRCFEMSDCSSCRDSYFCHNSEDLADCMFCFNTKGMKYAIGNVEIGKANYERVKKLVLDEIVSKLEKNKRIEWTIFNIGIR